MSFDIDHDRARWTLNPHHPLFSMRVSQMEIKFITLSPSEKLDEQREDWAQKRDQLIASGKGLA